MEESDAYSNLKKTIVINIMGYNIIKESNKKHTHFKIIEKDENFVLTEDLQIHREEWKHENCYGIFRNSKFRWKNDWNS